MVLKTLMDYFIGCSCYGIKLYAFLIVFYLLSAGCSIGFFGDLDSSLHQKIEISGKPREVVIGDEIDSTVFGFGGLQVGFSTENYHFLFGGVGTGSRHSIDSTWAKRGIGGRFKIIQKSEPSYSFSYANNYWQTNPDSRVSQTDAENNNTVFNSEIISVHKVFLWEKELCRRRGLFSPCNPGPAMLGFTLGPFLEKLKIQYGIKKKIIYTIGFSIGLEFFYLDLPQFGGGDTG